MRYKFSGCILDTERHLLHRAGRAQPVRQLLVYLLTQRGRVVSKQELADRVWPDRIVGESALEICIKDARYAVGDNGRAQRVIKTRYRLGYSFVADFVVLPDEPVRVYSAEGRPSGDANGFVEDGSEAVVSSNSPMADIVHLGETRDPAGMADDVAIYQSLRARARRRYHERVARRLTTGFPGTARNLPALVAHHYTEADARMRAIAWWRRAGVAALNRTAYAAALHHGRAGLALIETLPDSARRKRLELACRLIIGRALMESRGFFAPDIERTYDRITVLCRQVGNSQQRATALMALRILHAGRGALRTAR